jgi:phosphate/sulfate permease
MPLLSSPLTFFSFSLFFSSSSPSLCDKKERKKKKNKKKKKKMKKKRKQPHTFSAILFLNESTPHSLTSL